MMGKLLAAALATAICCTYVHAADRIDVCAKEGNGRTYKAQATYVTGTELNQATRSLDYNGLSKYVVIFWDKGQASVIELSFPSLNAIGTDGRDQQGRPWSVSTDTSFCF